MTRTLLSTLLAAAVLSAAAAAAPAAHASDLFVLKNSGPGEARAEDDLQFQIQDLMSRYNQAEPLASSILRKKDETGKAIISKI